MTKILAFCGRKQSGKNSAFNFLLATQLLDLSIVREKVEMDEKGKIHISDLFGNKAIAGVFDPDSTSQTVKDFIKEYVHPYIKNYSFADLLKQKVCIDVLGLKHEQVYGTDEQKQSLTHLRWENMPGVVTENTPDGEVEAEVVGRLGKYYERVASNLVYHAPGPMTAREVLQYVGTEVFRKMHPTVWAEGTVRRIQEEGSDFAIITDTRFPDEVQAVKDAGGKVIRLTRCPFPNDNHPSESSLDEDKYDWSNFDAVIDNRNLSLHDTNRQIFHKLREWDWVGPLNI